MKDTQSVHVTRVIDGDTVEIKTKPGLFRNTTTERVRLYGIDAPESSQKGGPQSTKQLRKLIGSRKKIWLQSSGRDQYGRIVAIIYPRKGSPQDSYNYRMVLSGHAHCYMLQPQHQATYQQAQAEAKEKRRGLWKQSSQTKPWDHRRAESSKSKAKPWKFLIFLIAILLVAWILMHLYNFLST